jgi:hypothetical protein
MNCGNWYVTAYGYWFCMVNGWVRDVEDVHRAISASGAGIVKDVQPGVTLYEVSA